MRKVPKFVWSLLACVVCIVATAAVCLLTADQGSSSDKYLEILSIINNDYYKEVDISGMPFDQEKVVQRFGAFQQMTNQLVAQKYTEPQMADAMRAQFGDTFWFFYFLVRDVKSY